MDTRDPFKELTFDGRPGQYREFRRKVILSVAALEDKHQCLAGPKLLSRLSGEAWRCTEHLSIADVRSDRGWLTVLECLDKHYRHLPEVELHESIDDILFHLKKRPHEGTTAFSARFKTALSRLETLIHSEREASKTKRRKRGDDKRRLTPASPVESSVEDSYDSPANGSEAAEQTDDTEGDPPSAPRAEPTETAAAGTPGTEEPQATSSMPKSGSKPASEKSAKSEKSGKSSMKSSKKHSTGTEKGDAEKAQMAMRRMLGTLEPSHRKPKPIFPQSVLGHLFMRKFGLNREQRALVIRSTGGSSRFLDVERILRASDLEDQRSDDRRLVKPQLKPGKRDTFAVQENDPESSSIEMPMSETDESIGEVFAEEEVVEDESENELAEVYEIQKKAKRDFKKNFKTYKETN